MIKARLLPVYFDPGRDDEFDTQVDVLRHLLAEEAELLAPVPLGTTLPDADAVVLPQLLGAAYSCVEALRDIGVPILVLTSEFGTLSMWDWEIVSYLRSEGVSTIAPYSLEQTRRVCRALAVRRDLRRATFVVYQDDPGEGFQASIFKRFYWWEDECLERVRRRFGVAVTKRSYAELAARAVAVPDSEADAAWQRLPLRTEGVTPAALRAAVKLYVAIERDLREDPTIRAVGVNCLNESRFSQTTPCLAWARLYEERGLVWGCEADVVSMLTQSLLQPVLRAPLMMSNLYPFLMGQSALKHEHIPEFPAVEAPEDCILAAHCGYLGVVPPSSATEWTLRPKVLAIVDDDATAIDARLAEGAITLAKLAPTLETLTVAEGVLDGYAQYPGSHCLNGAVIRVADGYRLVRELPSHHCLIVAGEQVADLSMAAPALGLKVETL
ncbi:MAG: hypothetical protein ACYC5O_01495 [Anaerolineae bacterium]